MSLQNIGHDDLNISKNLSQDILSQNQRPFQIRNDYGYAQQNEFIPQDYFVHKISKPVENLHVGHSCAQRLGPLHQGNTSPLSQQD
jgi:hypothetical protein